MPYSWHTPRIRLDLQPWGHFLPSPGTHRVFPDRLPGTLQAGSRLPLLPLGPHRTTRLAQRGPLVHTSWLPQGPGFQLPRFLPWQGRFLHVHARGHVVWPVGRTWGAAQAVPPVCVRCCVPTHRLTHAHRGRRFPLSQEGTVTQATLPGAPSWEG